ncbi:MAG: insulinase family protein [Nitrospiraceae bacterium]|nr:MAG: insulinase family protein [Nitrospiraceae bacterium]
MFKKEFLDNKIPVLMETAKEARSLCIGIWVKVGARYERPDKNGVSHFLEHMFFKGTVGRTAEGIAMEIDSLGGEINALTSSEYTLFYVKVLDEYINKAEDLLTDIFLNSTFPETDIEKEKSIINEEIKMVEDTPSDYVHDLFSRNVWGETGLGMSVLGQSEIIGEFKRNDLLEHIGRFYGTENIVAACSGNFREEEFMGYLNRSLGSLQRSGEKKNEPPPEFRSGLNVISKDLSEAHVCLGVKGLPYSSEDRYSMHLLNTILGSGYSSRLFQNIREKRGLAYSIHSYHASYSDAGIWVIYAGTDRKKVSEIINITMDEMRGLHETITSDELQRAKAQLKGNLILALESTSNKMTNIAKQEIYYGKYLAPDEIIRLVDSLTLDNVKDLAQRITGDDRFALTVYGPVKDEDIYPISFLGHQQG